MADVEKMRAEGVAAGLRTISESLDAPGGQKARRRRLFLSVGRFIARARRGGRTTLRKLRRASCLRAYFSGLSLLIIVCRLPRRACLVGPVRSAVVVQAMVQRLAEQYIDNIGDMAKNAKLIIVPDKPNDISSVLTTALGVGGQVNAQASSGMLG